MTDDAFERLDRKLDLIVRLLALGAVADMSSMKDKAVRLQRAGMTPKEIAALFGTTPNTISVALSTAKRDAKKE